MPVEVQNLVKQVLDLKQPRLFLVLFELRIAQVISAESHIRAVLDDGIAPRDEVEVRVCRVVDSDLVRTHVEVTVLGLVDEAGSADAPRHQLAIGDILEIERLDREGQNNLAVLQVFQNEVLFVGVFFLRLPDCLVVQVFDEKVVRRYFDS